MSDGVKDRSASVHGSEPTTITDGARGGGGGGNVAGPSTPRCSQAGTLLKLTLQDILAKHNANKLSGQSTTSRAQEAGGRSGGSIGAGGQMGVGGRGAGVATGSRSGGAGIASPSLSPPFEPAVVDNGAQAKNTAHEAPAAFPQPPNGVEMAAGALDGEAAGAVREQDVVNEEGGRGGARWRRRFYRVAKLVVGALVFTSGVAFAERWTLPPPCKGSNLEHGSEPLLPGECIEWEGASWGLFQLLPGVKAKSRLTVTEGGGTYSGPDGIKVPIGDVILEAKGGVGGLLCGAERIVRKVTGRGDAQYTARMVRSQLVFGAGKFCRTYATPAPPTVFAALHRGEARFSSDGHLEVIGREGNVVWSAIEALRPRAGVTGGLAGRPGRRAAETGRPEVTRTERRGDGGGKPGRARAKGEEGQEPQR